MIMNRKKEKKNAEKALFHLTWFSISVRLQTKSRMMTINFAGTKRIASLVMWVHSLIQ